MNYTEITKMAAKTVVSMGTSTIVTSIVKNNVQPDNVYSKIAVTAASFVIGSMAGAATSKYTGDMIDEGVNFVNDIKNAQTSKKNQE